MKKILGISSAVIILLVIFLILKYVNDEYIGSIELMEYDSKYMDEQYSVVVTGNGLSEMIAFYIDDEYVNCNIIDMNENRIQALIPKEYTKDYCDLNLRIELYSKKFRKKIVKPELFMINHSIVAKTA